MPTCVIFRELFDWSNHDFLIEDDEFRSTEEMGSRNDDVPCLDSEKSCFGIILRRQWNFQFFPPTGA
jgi:hypothetical protein